MTDSHSFIPDLNNEVRCDHCGAHITDERHSLDQDFPRADGAADGVLLVASTAILLIMGGYAYVRHLIGMSVLP